MVLQYMSVDLAWNKFTHECFATTGLYRKSGNQRVVCALGETYCLVGLLMELGLAFLFLEGTIWGEKKWLEDEKPWTSFPMMTGYIVWEVRERLFKPGTESKFLRESCKASGSSAWVKICTTGPFGGEWETKQFAWRLDEQSHTSASESSWRMYQQGKKASICRLVCSINPEWTLEGEKTWKGSLL